jgi:hypothetical protein
VSAALNLAAFILGKHADALGLTREDANAHLVHLAVDGGMRKRNAVSTIKGGFEKGQQCPVSIQWGNKKRA